MRFNTLNDVLAHQFVGNYAADREAFAAIEEFMNRPTTTTCEAREADRHLTEKGMGQRYVEE